MNRLVFLLGVTSLLGGCAQSPNLADCQILGAGYTGLCPKPLSLQDEKFVCLKLKEVQVDRRKKFKSAYDFLAFQNDTPDEDELFISGASAREYPEYYRTGNGYVVLLRIYRSADSSHEESRLIHPEGSESPERLKECPLLSKLPPSQTAHR